MANSQRFYCFGNSGDVALLQQGDSRRSQWVSPRRAYFSLIGFALRPPASGPVASFTPDTLFSDGARTPRRFASP